MVIETINVTHFLRFLRRQLYNRVPPELFDRYLWFYHEVEEVQQKRPLLVEVEYDQCACPLFELLLLPVLCLRPLSRAFQAFLHQYRSHQLRWILRADPVFYEQFFRRLDEEVFSVLYSEKKSRPNTPVNILVGLETLKSGFGWSDEELYDHFLFDLQVRYALGLRDFAEGYFDLRTLYYFRAALVEYEQKHEINLIRQATEQITDEQIKEFEVKTGLQRMDSTQLQSNIRKMSRLQLLVEIIYRPYRMLSEEDKSRHESLFGSYVQEDSLHYCYRVSSDEVEGQLQQIGIDLSSIAGPRR